MRTDVDEHPHGTSETELAGLLLGVLPRMGKLAAQAAHERGVVSPERARVLWQLRDRPLRSGELALRGGLTAPALSELVDSLVRDGICKRAEDPSDRRVVVVELTARGRRELERAREVMTERLARVLSKLPAENRARLRAALADLVNALESPTEETTHAR